MKCTVIMELFLINLNNFENVRYIILISNEPLWDQNIFEGISFPSSSRKSVQDMRFGYFVGCNAKLKASYD